MHTINIDRGQVKQEAKTILQTAQVSPKQMTLFFMGIVAVLSTASSLLPSVNLLDLIWNLVPDTFTTLLITGTFVSILVTLMIQVLTAGYVMYCAAVRKGHQMSFTSLFDGFSFASKIVVLMITQFLFIWLWSMLFFFPGVIASYRYRFALLNLCKNPELTPHQALDLSKRQTNGYKLQLFMLDISFLPWMILIEVPYCFLTGLSFAQPELLPAIWVQMAITALWRMLVSTLYLPLYQTSEIMYFEIATEPQDNSQPTTEIWQ